MPLIASDIIGLATNYCLIDGDQARIPATEDAQLFTVLNTINAEYVEAPRNAGGNGWAHMRGDRKYDIIAPKVLTADVIADQTTIPLDSLTDLDADGAMYVWDDSQADVFEYTGSSVLNLTGVTGVGGDYLDGTEVYKLYKLPSDFGWLRNEESHPNGVRINNIPATMNHGVPGVSYPVYLDPSYAFAGQFSLVRSSDPDGRNYIFVPPTSSATLTVVYDKKPTSITDNDSQLDIPTKDRDFAVWRLAEYIHSVTGDDQEQMNRARNLADGVLQRSLSTRSNSRRVRLLV